MLFLPQRVDESQYAGDGEMEYIVHRLQSAAADPEMRYQMNAEEYFIPPLQDRDTVIMEQTKLIEQKDAALLQLQILECLHQIAKELQTAVI